MKTFVKLFLLTLAVLLLGRQTAECMVVKQNVEGGLEMQGAEIRIYAYAEGWNTLSVRGSWKQKDLESEVRKFQLVQNGVCFFEGESKWRQTGNNTIEGDVKLVCVKQVSMQSFSLALQVPLSVNKGGEWTAGEASYVIPTGKSYSGEQSRFCVPLENDRKLTVQFDAPIHYLEQDLSEWTDAWSLRFGAEQNPRMFEKGEKVAYHLRLSATDEMVLKSVNERVIVQEGPQWVRFRNYKDIVKGSALDFSNQKLQEAPAGKFGWLKTNGGTFEFEKRQGKPYRFYGVNLCFTANYPTHEIADKLTDRLVRLGYNSIRIHHYDDTWAKGDPEMLDRLDYLLAKSIEKGLYITTDMFVSRNVSWKELGVDRDGYVEMDLFKTLVGCFEPAFKNWCDFSRKFLEHRNSYTGRMYKDEPGMPLISLVNEGELFMGFNSKAAEPIVQQAYREFTGTDEKLEYFKGRFKDFSDWLERRTTERCTAYLREIGCKALLTNDNNGGSHGEGESATPLYDYVDNHFYIDHPSFLDRNWALPSRCDNSNPVSYGGPGMFRKNYAKGFSKPYTISEWNFSGPGKYRGLGGLLTGAKAAVQEWDGLWRFAYAHSMESMVDNEAHYPGYFDVATDPLSQASDRASICLFLRGDAVNEEDLMLDSKKGVLKLNTKRTCGIFAPDGEHTAGVLTAEIIGVPGTVCLSSLDGKDLQKSRHMLLSHVTDVQGDGTVYADAERKVLLKWGYGTLIERGKAQISIAVAKPHGYKIYELDTAGRRIKPLSCQWTESGISFTVSTDSEDGTGRIYYEIVK